MSRKREDPTAWMYKDNPLVKVGDMVRRLSNGEWLIPGSAPAIVPAGSVGVVESSWTKEWGDGCAIRFHGVVHPIHGAFPADLTVPGKSHYSHAYELIARGRR